VQKPVEPILKPVELVSTKQKSIECPVECPAEPVFSREQFLAKTDLKRLYYILSLRINKGKMEVLDQGF
jgi:hypothetical protein